MKKFIEYQYDGDPFFDDRERDIRAVTTFDIHNVDVPSDAISFTFIEARNLKSAQNKKLKSVPVYYLSKPEEITTTQEMRQRSRMYDLSKRMMLNHIELEGGDPIAAMTEVGMLFEQASKESAEKLADELLKDIVTDDFSSVMADFTANALEQHGCHRVIGPWPMYCRGVHDKDIILDRDTRDVISPPLTKPTVRKQP